MKCAPTTSCHRRAFLSRAFAGSLGLMLLGMASSRADEPSPADVEFFEAKVRPVLVEQCVGCHGAEKAKSGLRLDGREEALQGGDGGPAIVPGDPANSPLIAAIGYATETKMPPKQQLPPQAIADLTEWVRRGAPWPAKKDAAAKSDPRKTHWAFQPIRRPDVPPVQDDRWPATDIDRFLLARMEAKGVKPSPPADRRALIRRAAFDLTGLPPSPEEVAAFEADPAPDAFAKVVDRLLASPHYGERWGRHWLDVARYGDTKGYVFVSDPEYYWAYTYRDWVVKALNEDRPYDDFVVRQLAADRLVSPSGEGRKDLPALGFLTVGSAFMQNNQDVLDDRIDVVTRGLMGLTVACARCHDHKFDPIPTADYYSLYGVFAGSVEPGEPPVFDEPPKTPEYDAYLHELKAKEAALADFLRSKQDAILGSVRQRVAEYLLAEQPRIGKGEVDEDEPVTPKEPLHPRFRNRWRRFLERTEGKADPVFEPWHALARVPRDQFTAKARSLCDEWLSRPDLARPINPIVARTLAEAAPRNMADVAKAYAHLLNANEAIWQEYAARAALNGSPAIALPDPAREQLRLVYHGNDAPGDLPSDRAASRRLVVDEASKQKLAELEQAAESWRVNGPGAPARAMTLVDAPQPFEPRIFRRGNPGNLGDPVPRRFLKVLSGPERAPFKDGSGRLELARAIVSKDNPLTARAIVNRVWMHHFGRPIVGTPGDFGLRSDPPSHPELLDHLASSFMADGWSLKRLHRRILLSAAYGQASDDRAECLAADPENSLVWKMNRRRLDFESTRDALLAASGKLDRSLGGRAIADIVAPGTGRRTLYGKIDRLRLLGVYRTFDFPDPSGTNPRRDQTTVTPQALFLMNHPFVAEAAAATLGRPDVAAEPDAPRKVDRLYHILYGRGPSAEELALAIEFLAGTGETAWKQYVQALMLANEFAFVD